MLIKYMRHIKCNGFGRKVEKGDREKGNDTG